MLKVTQLMPVAEFTLTVSKMSHFLLLKNDTRISIEINFNAPHLLCIMKWKWLAMG